MDLGISPDCEAYWCYLVVIIAGTVAAVQQITHRLAWRAWVLFETWVLFVAYVSVPLLLFWLLDRSGAITDTSLFAALLVGLGYERILAGSVDKVQLPGEISRLWQPFVAWADRLAKRSGEKLHRNQQRFIDRVVSRVATSQSILTSLLSLVRGFHANIDQLDADLNAIEDQQQILGLATVQRRKARLLYESMLKQPDGEYILYQNKIITREAYWWNVIGLRTGVTVFLVAATALACGLVLYFRFAEPQNWGRYYLWRITKLNATEADRFRAREQLSAYLNDTSLATWTLQTLAQVLKRPGVPLERVDVIVRLLIKDRGTAQPSNDDLAMLLIDALRADASDARSRIHLALVFLYKQSSGTDPDEELGKWNPSEGDSPTKLEERIRQWTRLWTDRAKPQTGS